MSTPKEYLARTILLMRDYVQRELGDDDIAAALQNTRVLIASDSRNLENHSGQTALITLVLLLNHMGIQVELDVPAFQLRQPHPVLKGEEGRDALIQLDEALIPHTRVMLASEARPDAVFLLGDTPAPSKVSSPSWRVAGAAFGGGIHPLAYSAPAWTESIPIGAMSAAALAAGEVFKLVMRSLPFRADSDREFFEPSLTATWDFGSFPVPSSLPSTLDVVSAGAISQAALYALAQMPDLSINGRIFDADLTGASNLNRNMLSLRSDINKSKVVVVSDRLAPQLQFEPNNLRLGLNELQRTHLSTLVLVGVDDIPSRWAIQAAAKGWVGVGGTTHFNVSVSSHKADEPCSACLHNVDDPVVRDLPTVAFVSFWAGLCTAVKLMKHCAEFPDRRQHLWLTPLRMDQENAAMWFPVPAFENCPAKCSSSQRVCHTSIL